jgi:hypothetical protein
MYNLLWNQIHHTANFLYDTVTYILQSTKGFKSKQKRKHKYMQEEHKYRVIQNPCPVYRWKGNLSKFWYRWSEVVHHWGCGCCYLWHAATSVGRAGLSIWHLPHHTWGSHRVFVRCENNFESSPFSLYIAHHHIFNSTCKIHF